MERRKNKLWGRRTTMLLFLCFVLVLLCGCSGWKSITPPMRETEATEATPIPESELLETMDQARAFIEKMAHDGAEEFTLVCSEEIYDFLLRTTYKTDGWERKAYHSLLDQAGFYDYGTVTAGLKRTITVYVISLYPGYEILRSIETGKEDTLSSKLKKTLEEARSIAETCQTSDPLETAENIQRILCSQVSYANMTNMSDVDTAVGPLLNGVADCDGYADAFYLIGNLAGLEVRYQHGMASYYDEEESKLVTSSHMWNLLKIDGSWRVVDVCWADGSRGVDYTWFNIGKDRASRSRIWYEELTVPLLETTDLSTRPETEYSVTSYEELEAAMKEAIGKEQSSFTIIFDRDNYGSRGEAFDVLWNLYNGEVSYYWDECTRALTLILEETGAN